MRTAKSAGRVTVLENSDAISEETHRIQERIRQRAYELSLMRGHSGRDDTDDWLSAESEIISVPPVELVETGVAYEVQCGIAVINPADVKVMAAPDQILVKCDFRHDHESTSGIVHLCDFKSTTVFRSVRFPQPINVQKVEVDFRDGLFRITAGKADVEQAHPKSRPPVRKAAVKKAKKAARGARP